VSWASVRPERGPEERGSGPGESRRGTRTSRRPSWSARGWPRWLEGQRGGHWVVRHAQLLEPCVGATPSLIVVSSRSLPARSRSTTPPHATAERTRRRTLLLETAARRPGGAPRWPRRARARAGSRASSSEPVGGRAISSTTRARDGQRGEGSEDARSRLGWLELALLAWRWTRCVNAGSNPRSLPLASPSAGSTGCAKCGRRALDSRPTAPSLTLPPPLSPSCSYPPTRPPPALDFEHAARSTSSCASRRPRTCLFAFFRRSHHRRRRQELVRQRGRPLVARRRVPVDRGRGAPRRQEDGPQPHAHPVGPLHVRPCSHESCARRRRATADVELAVPTRRLSFLDRSSASSRPLVVPLRVSLTRSSFSQISAVRRLLRRRALEGAPELTYLRAQTPKPPA